MALLKRCLRELGISQRDFALAADVNVTSLNLAFSGTFPKQEVAFKSKVSAAIFRNERITAWLTERNKRNDIWAEDREEIKRTPRTGELYKRTKPFRLADATELETTEEAEMLTGAAMKQFKIFKNPFSADVNSVDDIYYSEDHIFIRELMLDAARNAGFAAIYGEVGSGKSVMRKAVCEQLKEEGIAVVYPVILDKSRISPASLLDAIISDIAPETKPKMRLEMKTRQALKLLRDRFSTGHRQVLIIEEAHMLDITAFKSLKQIAELEEGFRKLCGIVLIGQPELQFILSDSRHDMREVTRRITKAQITGMSSDDVKSYLVHKLARVGCKADKVFTDDAYEAFKRKLSGTDTKGREENQTYPLSINSLSARAMNMAARIGEERVTADIVLKA